MEQDLFPVEIVPAGDELRADHALRLVRQNRALLWHGDYRNARQLLAAMGRRLDRRPREAGRTPSDTFHDYRQAVAQRAHVLSRVLVELGPDYHLALPHAPDVSSACLQAFGPLTERLVLPLPELLGVLGAHQWRIRGVRVPVLDQAVHPHYSVFAPTRQEYLDLVAEAPLPPAKTVFDIGTGTGVLALLLAHRGAGHVVATDIEARAVVCARDNVSRHGLDDRVSVEQTDMFPAGRADLVVCNPPWLPAVPASSLDAAVYDPDSQMLRRFLRDLPEHLVPGGEAWLIMSDLAERLGLRARDELTAMFAAAGLTVLDRLDTRPRHRPRHRQGRRADPLAEYRAAEITSLWRLSSSRESGTSGSRHPG